MLNRLWDRLGNCLSSIFVGVETVLSSCISGPRLMVALGLADAAGSFIGSYGLSFWWLVPAGLSGAVCGFVARRWKVAVLLLLLPAVSWSYCLWRTPRPAVDDLARWISLKQVIFRACVIADLSKPESHSKRFLLSSRELLFPVHRKLSGKTILTVSGAPCSVAEGDVIEATTRLKEPQPVQHDWDFDYARYLSRQYVFSVCSSFASQVKVLKVKASSAEAVGVPAFSAIDNWLTRLRSRLTDVHRRFAGQPEGDLLQSMVLGDRTVNLSPDITQKFRDLGLSHILAASGFNITIVTGVTWWFARLLLRSVWSVNLVCFSAMILYVGLAGPSPSVVRAALMCSFVLLSRCLYRTLYVPAALSLALLVTLAVDPGSITDVGLQLSYAATTGIICGAHSLGGHIKSLGSIAVPGWLREALSVALVAQASVLPIQLAYFQQIGLFFLPANLIVTPIVTVVTILGFISSALVMVDFSGLLTNTAVRLIDGLSIFPIRAMLAAVNLLSACEEAKLHLGSPSGWSIAVYYLCLALLFGCVRAGRHRIFAGAAYALAMSAVLWRPAPAALTVASFPGALILMDRDRQAICLGDVQDGEAARFLSFSGARIQKQGTSRLHVVNLSASVSAMESGEPPARILVVDGGAAVLKLPESIPQCSTVVLTGPTRPGTGSQAGQPLPYSGGAPDQSGIEKIVKECRCSFVVINCESRRFRRQLNLLERKLYDISGVKVLRSDRHEFMLVANCGIHQGTPSFRPVLPAVAYDCRIQNRN